MTSHRNIVFILICCGLVFVSAAPTLEKNTDTDCYIDPILSPEDQQIQRNILELNDLVTKFRHKQNAELGDSGTIVHNLNPLVLLAPDVVQSVLKDVASGRLSNDVVDSGLERLEQGLNKGNLLDGTLQLVGGVSHGLSKNVLWLFADSLATALRDNLPANANAYTRRINCLIFDSLRAANQERRNETPYNDVKNLVNLLLHYIVDIAQGTLSYARPTINGLSYGLRKGLEKGDLVEALIEAVKRVSDAVAKSTQVGYNNVFKSQMQKQYTPFVGL